MLHKMVILDSSLPLLTLSLILLSSVSPSLQHDKTYKDCFYKIFAFGESYTDTGNANALGDLIAFSDSQMEGSPYGSTHFGKPVNRFSDGRLIVDFISEKFSIPYLPSFYNSTVHDFSHGVNFAVAGSSALPSDYYLNHTVGRTVKWKDIPVSLQSQVDWFEQFVREVDCNGKDENACKAQMEHVLFWIGEMGMSDYYRTFGNAIPVESLIEMIVDIVCKLLKAILAKGGNYIVVQGLPPTGCLPLDLSLAPTSDYDGNGCAKSANSIILAHNDYLQKKIEEIRHEFPNSKILYADLYSAYLEIMKNTKQYGFEEAFKACCGAGGGRLNFDMHSICGSEKATICTNPTKYMNWDGLHLTEAMYGKLADLFFDKGFCRPSFDQLLKSKNCA